ncbi:hypothetical protein NDI54_11985 [Haloarcula sp. S1AR25-5A]|uniref:Uncharacterized protein n=1 Tax=Haloarcula terrestris TaxID=2950533 RepID=A0AAE4EXV1_9EURY|nr:hypothetical protein [Haloarcula terrestris]MDS0222068.1 hypothetical protein [Haloarcula terrestris]
MLDFPLSQWAFVCAVTGAFVGLLLNIPMVTQDEGYLPAYVAAGGLTRTNPTAVSRPLAVLVHHVTAVIAALLYGVVVAVLAFVLPTAVSLNGVPLLPHVVGAAGVTAFIYYFFARIAMPRFGGSLRDRGDEIVEQWALTAFIYGTALALFVPVLVTQI